jgi:ABC-type antimicrobial peptide transport system permease subunit
MLLDSIWDYFIDINIGILLAASAVMIAATILTIAFKIINAAKRNPVDSLRYE